MSLSQFKTLTTSRAGILCGAALAAAATATWVEVQARRAERKHPPSGQIIDVDGARLHYVERGHGPPVLLIHGNAVSLADFEASGLIEKLALDHRVIAIDRPGFGYSTRPRDRLWTPTAQASVLQSALKTLGVERPIVVGHSMGTLIALAMALDNPTDVGSLVLLGGYYYPTVRIDALLTTPVAIPVLGDVMRYTVTALSARALLTRSVEVMFSPGKVPASFFPILSREMLLRPVQLRANAEDAAFMIPAATASSARYKQLELPVTIIAGAADKVVDVDAHSRRLHRDVPQSKLVVVPGAGHMVHYADPESVVAAVKAGGADVDTPVASLAQQTDTKQLPDAEPAFV
ncbi:alpha/beta fold hydrolase [Variovorax sp. J22R115]|uniref:alpha/beta fold hydrolase n=1 Tax=Variovorax sp. J22R115 TaxID=3053509 RepID=UPI002578711E|nr:alpha/beta hydrolase [Variovorax sp. J22R115]MDM0050585.1 alpha/beta hydrolase [Variovorax sp. J22R115]